MQAGAVWSAVAKVACLCVNPVIVHRLSLHPSVHPSIHPSSSPGHVWGYEAAHFLVCDALQSHFVAAPVEICSCIIFLPGLWKSVRVMIFFISFVLASLASLLA